MNFETLKAFREEYTFDEVQIIGKDAAIENEMFHVAALARRGTEVKLFALSRCRSFDEMNEEYDIYSSEKTNRERMEASLHAERQSSFLKEIRQGEQVISFRSSATGNIENGDYVQGYVLFMRLLDAGWEPENSVFLRGTDWKNIALTEVTLAGEYDSLPRLDLSKKGLPVMGETSPGAVSCLLAVPVLLEAGKEQTVLFAMEDGTKAFCYINRVYLQDLWEEQERQFADKEYRSKMLQHMSAEQLNEMKEKLDAALENLCPRGKRVFVVEYECSEDVSLKFYAKEYLDAIPKPSYGSAMMLMMHVKPDENTGKHGQKLQACVVETPVEPGETKLETELFSYTRIIPSREVQLFQNVR